MLRIRRLSAFLLSLLFVQITVLGAGAGCSMEPTTGEEMPWVAGTESLHGAEGHADHAQHGKQESPGRSSDGHDATHCIVSVACAMAGLAGREASLAEPELRATAGVVGADLAAPRSLGHAPEPPPPRA